jgi:crotonobetainyl-CoA:carnitine CoA-transferase CaiB-like acyl-CoA transferase
LTGTNLTLAVLAAIYHRDITGEGQYIDISMAESIAAQIPEAITDYVMNGRIAARKGNHDDAMVPHNCYPCAGHDQWVAIAISNDEEWQAFCRTVDHQEWSADPRFCDCQSRKNNEDVLDGLIAEWTKNHTKWEVTDLLQRANVPAGPNLDIEELVHSPHLEERGFFVAPNHPETGPRIHAGIPWILSECSSRLKPAPMLGEHNEYVFCELLGLSDEEFPELVADGVIA